MSVLTVDAILSISRCCCFFGFLGTENAPFFSNLHYSTYLIMLCSFEQSFEEHTFRVTVHQCSSQRDICMNQSASDLALGMDSHYRIVSRECALGAGQVYEVFAKTFAPRSHTFSPSCSRTAPRAAPVYEDSSLSVIPVGMAGDQVGSKPKNNGRQRLTLKSEGKVLRVHASAFTLTIRRKAPSAHQEAASCSQKPTFTSNTTISQEIFIQKSFRPRNTDASLPSNEQRSCGRESDSP